MSVEVWAKVSLLLFFLLAFTGCALSLQNTATPVLASTAAPISTPVDEMPLFNSVESNDVKGTEELLRGGADPYQNIVDTNKPIDFAASEGHLALVRLLIRCMPRLTHSQVQTYLQQAKNVALDKAVASGTFSEVNALLADGADVNNRDANDASGVGSPLMCATARGSLPLMRHLLAHGANVNQEDEYGRTALMYVSGLNMYYSPYNEEPDDNVPAARLTAGPARLLLQHGANMSVCDNDGKTVLMWAAQLNPQVVSLLLAHKMRIDKKDKSGRTALLCAASVRDPASITLLLAASADVNAQDKSGETPLMRASVLPEPPADAAEMVDRHKSMMLLLRNGANPHLKDKRHKTATDYAKMNDSDFITAS